MLDKVDPYKTMSSVLKRRFDTETVSNMLDNAETVGSTKVLAEKLREALG
ncbi:hypothetical protein PF005_g14773 [Phytophthora fragariae]|nr:hypothetical protein PF009_g16010 [Phytophthora fragariae]KAE9082043.1 hypothetical protein PF007_g22425 [Phytophthora fragariae]KAE9105997.1 hypothetical protein PF006_g21472 [Phytophthora fragariae]KAE9194592.1 hypothetical protein PF002_g23552 [Phytophthora fragariae]KAE9201907.1 hypothetical protein PF005_g14773 [Phytophthora fragariae]